MRGGREQPAADRRVDREPGGDATRKRHGRHYTPMRLAEFLAERMLAHLRPGPEISILDPACGDGELLLAVAALAARRYPATSVRLIGYDLDAEAVRTARSRGVLALGRGCPDIVAEIGAAPGRVDFDWRTGDFLAAATELADSWVDAVITNPPYVRTQQLGGGTAQLLSRQFGLSGRIDLTHPFVATVPRLLRPGGVLGLLCANRFLSTKAGANLRSLLFEQLTPVELYDLGDTRLFEAAVLPAVTIAVRGHRRRTCRFVTAYESDREPTGRADLFAALTATDDSVVRHGGRRIAIEIGTLWTGAPAEGSAASRSRRTAGAPTEPAGGPAAAGFDPAVPWRMSRPETDEWLRRVGGGTWRTFGDIARIRVGIKTTADRVFISDRWDDRPCRPEPELLRDLLTHHDLAPWRIERARDTRVLYPYDGSCPCRRPVDLNDYPAAAAYLAQHKDVLAARDYLTGSGREWYEIWVPHRPQLWGRPKVVFPDISVTPRFALDRSGAVVNGDCYWMSLADIGDERIAYLLMAVANSTLGRCFYDAVCGNRLYAGRRRWITQYVMRLPLPDPETAAARSLVELAGAFADGRAEPDQAVLDERVAAAFGLDPAGVRPAGR